MEGKKGTIHEQFQPLTVQWFKRAFVYTGSIGDFRYRYATDKTVIHAATYSVYCYEAAQDKTEKDFPWTEDGVEELKTWMQSQYEAFLKK